MIVDFIDRHKKKFGVEPICAQLEALGCKFAPSSYYEARSRRPSARALRDEDLKKQIIAEYEENYRCCGARTMWLQLRGKGIDVARCTVERLMKVLGLQGVAGGCRALTRGKVKRTTTRARCALGERPGRAELSHTKAESPDSLLGDLCVRERCGLSPDIASVGAYQRGDTQRRQGSADLPPHRSRHGPHAPKPAESTGLQIRRVERRRHRQKPRC